MLGLLTTKMLISGLFEKEPPGGPEIRAERLVGVVTKAGSTCALWLGRGDQTREGRG